MHNTFLTTIFLLLSILGLVTASSEHAAAANLDSRNNHRTMPPAQTKLCLDYEWTANMSTIGSNKSYRTVLLQKSNIGTLYNARMMNDAMAKLPKLTADVELNNMCGNWTTIAHREAAMNFTQGIVAQYTTDGLYHGIKAGPIVVIVVGIILIIFSTVWVFIV